MEAEKNKKELGPHSIIQIEIKIKKYFSNTCNYMEIKQTLPG